MGGRFMKNSTNTVLCILMVIITTLLEPIDESGYMLIMLRLCCYAMWFYNGYYWVKGDE